jgi:hypothetical protein
MHPSPPAKPWHTPRLTPLSRTATAAGGNHFDITEGGHFLRAPVSGYLLTSGPDS